MSGRWLGQQAPGQLRSPSSQMRLFPYSFLTARSQRAWRAWVERGERALDALPPADLQALLSPQGLAMVRDAKARMAKAAAARRARVRAKTLAMAACLGLGAGIKGLGPGSKGLASGASTCRSAKSGRSVLGSRPESVAAGATSPGGRGAVAGSGGPSRKKAVPQRAAFGVGDKAHALSITKEPVAARWLPWCGFVCAGSMSHVLPSVGSGCLQWLM